MGQVNAGLSLTQIDALRKQGKSWTGAAHALGDTAPGAGERLRAKVRRQRASPLGADPVQAEAARQVQIASLREQRELLTGVASEQNLRNVVLRKLDAALPKLTQLKALRAPTPRSGVQGTESLVKQWSDWHAGEEVSAERTRGFNAYGMAEFSRRLARDTEATIHLTQMLQSGGWYFREMVLTLLGDLVSGTIHELERHSDANNIVECVVEVAGQCAQRIQQFAQVVPRVRVYSVSGNHGRLPDARRVQQKDPTRSWDAMIAFIVQKLLAKQENVNVVVPNAYSVAFDVEGHTFLASHGHDIKSWNQIPFYGISRYVTSINALEAARNRAIQYFLFAHFHNPASLTMPGCEYFINGSLIGGTEFGVNALGRVDRPCQWMMGVHRKHGVTHRWPVYCTGTDVEGSKSA